MSRVVVGVDGSEGSLRALRWAHQESRIRQWRLVAVLAWGWLDQYHGPRARADTFDPEYDADAATRALAATVQDVLGDAADVDLEAVCDLAAPALLGVAQAGDLLVVGARGRGGFLGLRLGSVSDKVLHHATVPVAVIRQDPSSTPSGDVVVGIDGSAAAQRALAWAAAEARSRSVRLSVVHAWHLATVGVEPYAFGFVDVEALRTAARETLEAAIRETDTSGIDVRSQLVEGEPAHALLRAGADASLLVVGTHGHTILDDLFIGSVTRRVVHRAQIPVVVVPDRLPS